MPLTKQAIKKMHHDKRVTKRNATTTNIVNKAIKIHRKTKTKATLEKVFSLLDKSAKRHIIHKNKASRLKSRLSKLVA